jgi:hypothetical protein
MSDVISAVNKQRRESGEAKSKAASPPHSASSRKVRELRIRPVKGGHIVATEHEPDGDEQGYCPPEEQVFTDHQAMLDHITKHTK